MTNGIFQYLLSASDRCLFVWSSLFACCISCYLLLQVFERPVIATHVHCRRLITAPKDFQSACCRRSASFLWLPFLVMVCYTDETIICCHLIHRRLSKVSRLSLISILVEWYDKMKTENFRVRQKECTKVNCSLAHVKDKSRIHTPKSVRPFF